MTGYIITDNENTIHGSGNTVDAAWEDAGYTFGCAGVTLLEDDDDASAEMGKWMYRSQLRVLPATPALLDEIERDGGLVAWRLVDGVATRL